MNEAWPVANVTPVIIENKVLQKLACQTLRIIVVSLTAIYCYPVKSCAGIALEKSEIDPYGIKFDRRWMIVDADGVFMTQRKFPQMVLIKPDLNGAYLTLKSSDFEDCPIPTHHVDKRIKVTVWKDTVQAHLVCNQVDAWLSQVLAVKCHLVYFSDKSKRDIDPDFSKPSEQVAFADAFPLLITNTASLAQLNQQLSSTIPMIRFRPNLVVTGAEPLDEHNWMRLQYDTLRIEMVKPCSRCVMTGVDPKTGKQTGNEPLKTLKTYNEINGKPVFGVNAIPRFNKNSNTVLSIGDKFKVIG
ncbi:MAG: MOSC N-terminal beta barrel domain-containing protein [Proteobacteria bacterium]|nr:MOSC N-terminal beta barrel domain-containing protein [Pseudomonadota bacterium]